MEIFSGFFLVGFLMVLVGVFLIYKSLHVNPHEITESNNARYIDPIIIVINGDRKWILFAFMITMVTILYLMTRTFYTNFFGGAVFG